MSPNTKNKMPFIAQDAVMHDDDKSWHISQEHIPVASAKLASHYHLVGYVVFSQSLTNLKSTIVQWIIPVTHVEVLQYSLINA